MDDNSRQNPLNPPLNSVGKRNNLRLLVGKNDRASIESVVAEFGIHATDGSQDTVAHWAAFYGNAELVQWAADQGANLNARDRAGMTPLQYAIQEKKWSVMELLLKLGVDVHAPGERGFENPPIATALSRNAPPEALVVLLNHGADPRRKNAHGNTFMLRMKAAAEQSPLLAEALGRVLAQPEYVPPALPAENAVGTTDVKSWSEKFQQLWSELVPPSGQALTVQGEVIRATGKGTDEAYRNGNGNWEGGFEQLWTSVLATLDDPSVFSEAERGQIRAAYYAIVRNPNNPDTSRKGSPTYILSEYAVRFCERKPTLIPRVIDPNLPR